MYVYMYVPTFVYITKYMYIYTAALIYRLSKISKFVHFVRKSKQREL
jgi:hypothetical protein